MLNENDIHYITGFLYLVSWNERISVVLGEKVYDEASETKRDVDIVVASDGMTELIGVEVKDEGRPLHVGIVEGICLKFSDMPTIKSRYLVSSSGYTKPARKKAQKHNVRCLTLVRGRVPPFPTIDLSRLEAIKVLHQEWIHGPRVTFMPGAKIPKHERQQLSDSTPVSYPPDVHNPQVSNAKELADVIARSLNAWEGPPTVGLFPVKIDIPIGDCPRLHLGDRILEVTEARAAGVIKVTRHDLSLEQSRYLEDEDGSVFAGAAIVEFKGDLYGFCVSNRSQELRTFYLPQSLRQIRPVRKTLPV